MTDVREAIIARMMVLLAAIPGVDEVTRNVIVADDDTSRTKRIALLEGDEMAAEEDPVARPANAPRTIHMHPQMLLSNFAKSVDVGTGLAAVRAAIIKSFASDSQLIALTLNNRGGRYLGMDSDLVFAGAMLGQTSLKFQFTYVLRPDSL
jgi:hypothetical protein